MLYPFSEEILKAAHLCASLGAECDDDEQGSHMEKFLEVYNLLRENDLALEYASAWNYDYEHGIDIGHNDLDQVLSAGFVVGVVIHDSPYGYMYLVPRKYVPDAFARIY